MTRMVGIFVYPEFLLLDAAGPIAAFEIASREVPGAYRVVVVSTDGGPVKSSSGVEVETAAAGAAGGFDTLLVVGGDGSIKAMQHPEATTFLRRAQPEVRRLCSVCSGAFLLASAGLLDGRRITTHWHRADQFRALFPAVRVEQDRIFIRDGAIWTSAGVSAAIDLALALVADDMGEALARRVAQEMVGLLPTAGWSVTILGDGRSRKRCDRFLATVRLDAREPH